VTFGTSSGNVASVQGGGIGRSLTVNLIPPGTPIHKGEVLTTSGLPDLAYPPSIPVATITKFSSTSSATQESVTAEPLADLDQLAYVDVLLWEPTS
jgi:cell shape-determining protein MreC